MLNLSGLLNTALNVAEAQGLMGTLTINRPAGTSIDPTTNVATGGALSQTIRAVQVSPTRFRTRGGAWTAADTVMLVRAAELQWTPVVGDLCVFGGDDFTVIEREKINVDGLAPLAWEFALGGQG